VPSNITSSLETINELSRLILSQLNIRIEDTEHESSQHPLQELAPETADNDQYSDEQLAKLVTKRHTLIDLLLKTFTQKQLSIALPQINEMVSLNDQLTSSSQRSKLALAEQVIKLKKSKKVTRLYQKY